MSICESCGMPMDKTTMSKFDEEYCVFCQDQNTGGLKTLKEVQVGCIGAAVRLMSKTQAEAEKMVAEMLPKLPRWKK